MGAACVRASAKLRMPMRTTGISRAAQVVVNGHHQLCVAAGFEEFVCLSRVVYHLSKRRTAAIADTIELAQGTCEGGPTCTSVSRYIMICRGTRSRAKSRSIAGKRSQEGANVLGSCRRASNW